MDFQFSNVQRRPTKNVFEMPRRCFSTSPACFSTTVLVVSQIESMSFVAQPQSAADLVDKVGRRFTISESSTDSEDSFIVFDDSWNQDVQPENLVIDEDDDDDTVIFQDLSGDEDEEDEIDFSCCIAPCDCLSCDSQISRVAYANRVWNSYYSEPILPKVTNRSGKKVSFAEGKPQVKSMVVWDYASRAARVGPWETYARDSDRFRNRIKQLSEVINPVISQPHRDKIYMERFQT